MGPLVWWWRLWSRVIDPASIRELADAQERAEEAQARATQLASSLAGAERDRDAARNAQRERDDELGSAQTRLTEVDGALTRARTELSDTTTELERTRARLTEVEGLAAELRARVDELLGIQADAEQMRAQIDQLGGAQAEVERLRAHVGELEAQLAQDGGAGNGSNGAGPAATADAEAGTDAPPDVAAAAEVLGKPVTLDDLTVVEGIGPKIAGLLADAGIGSWRQLADSDTESLRAILDEAGPRYRVHDPSGWPPQAAALAAGEWERFLELKAR